MGSTIRVHIDGRTLDFPAPRVVRIGRDPQADVVLTNLNASRQHAQLRWRHDAWELVDVGSSNGIHIAGAPVSRLRLDGPVRVRFGLADDGTDSFLEPLSTTAPAQVRNALGPPGPSSLLATTRMRPTRAEWPPVVVTFDGRRQEFEGFPVRIGRRPDLELVTAHPAVSREHGRLEPLRDCWRYIDTSTSGTFREGRAVRTVDIRAPESLMLGDPTNGATLHVAPQLPVESLERFDHRRRRRRVVAVVLPLLLVAVLTTVAVIFLVPTSDELSGEELDRAKQATVLLTASARGTDGGRVDWAGSGAIIDSRGLILTNAHVAVPQAPGQSLLYGPTDVLDPEYLVVSLSEPGDDRPATPAFRARVLIADGYIDAAVLEVYADADGEPLTAPLELPTVALGSSGDLRTGDDVTVLGFPAISDSDAISVTRGVISTFTPDDRIDSPRSEIDTDARIAPGNSGGLAIADDGELVGVPFAVRPDASSTALSGRIRPIDLIKPLIVLAGNGSDPDYESPYLRGGEASTAGQAMEVGNE